MIKAESAETEIWSKDQSGLDTLTSLNDRA